MEGHYNKIPAENQLLLSFFSGIWDASDSLDSLGVLSFFAALVALQCRVYTGFQTDAASRLAILFRLYHVPVTSFGEGLDGTQRVHILQILAIYCNRITH